MRDIIDADMGEHAKLFAIQDTVLFSVNSKDPQIQKAAALEWELALTSRHGEAWKEMPEESDYYSPALCFAWNGKKVSQDWFKKVNLALIALSYKPKTVLELGAGFGQVCRLMRLKHPALKYTIIDLRETLYFARLFLSCSMPDANIVLARCSDDFNLPCDILLVPSELAQEYAMLSPNIDIFINSSSLGEMDNETSGFYINLLQEYIKPKHAVLLNRLLNTYGPIVDNFRENESGWYFSLGKQWNVLHWELEPNFTLIPYDELYHNREIFLIMEYKYQAEVSPSEKHNIESTIKQFYWYRYFTQCPSHRWGNMLYVDYSILNILFELVRLNSSEFSLDALIKYLHVIGKRHPFEELPILYKKFEQVTGKSHPLAISPFKQFAFKAIFKLSRPVAKYVHWYEQHKA